MRDWDGTLIHQQSPLEPREEHYKQWPLRLAGLMLVIALMVQLFHFSPAAPDSQPVQLTQGKVQAHPTVADALLVSATLMNQSKKPRSYPQLEVRFLDLAGQTRFVRRFHPREYLEHAAQADREMPPGIPAPVRLEVVNPGLPVPSFQFHLY